MLNLTPRKALSWLLVVLLVPAYSIATAQGRMSARAKEVLDSHPHERIDLIVTYHKMPGPNQNASVKAHGGQVRHASRLIPGHAITVPTHAAAALANNPDVKRISYDAPVSGAAVMSPKGLTVSPIRSRRA